MTTKRTPLGNEVEEALGEVLSHVRGEIDLPCRIVDDPTAERIRALRKRFKLSRRKFADRFGLDARCPLQQRKCYGLLRLLEGPVPII